LRLSTANGSFSFSRPKTTEREHGTEPTETPHKRNALNRRLLHHPMNTSTAISAAAADLLARKLDALGTMFRALAETSAARRGDKAIKPSDVRQAWGTLFATPHPISAMSEYGMPPDSATIRDELLALASHLPPAHPLGWCVMDAEFVSEWATGPVLLVDRPHALAIVEAMDKHRPGCDYY
jgi:hypothetical protein